MHAPRSRAAALPGEIPVFPLPGALLLPGGKLPLNIFEPRYLALTEDALAAGRMFGMVQPDPALPDTEAGPGLYRIGCLGRLTSFSETEDGRYLITLSGLLRYRIVAEAPMRRGYRRMLVDYAPYLAELDTPADASAAAIGLPRETLLGALRGYFTRRGFDTNWDAIRKLGDAALVTTLCMVCPFEPAEKQALLEAPDLPARTGALHTLLQIGAAADPTDVMRPS